MKKGLRILHVINELQMGGAARLVADISHYMSATKDVEVGIITLRNSDNSEIYRYIKNHPHIKLYDLSGGRVYSLSKIRKIRKIMSGYDIVHAHLFPGGYLAALARTGKKCPVVYTEHSTHNRRREKKLFRPVERFVYSRYSATAAISAATRDSLSNWLKKDKYSKKIHTIPNGTDLSRFHNRDVSSQSGMDLFGKEGKAIIMISRFTESKDHTSLIKALPHIENQDAFVVFVGDGKTMESCKRLAEETGVTDRCIFLGNRGDIPELVGASYIGVQSSNWEGFGLTAIEMMAGGLPVIASDVPGLRNVVKGAGILFDKGDFKALANEINKLLADKETYMVVKQKCITRSLQYDIKNTADSYFDLYSRFIEI